MIASRLSIPMARPLQLGGLRPSTQHWSTQNETDHDPHTKLYKALDTPWQPFQLSFPLPLSRSLSLSTTKSNLAKKLLTDLDELAGGTTPLGRPHRTWPARPKFGVIADHREKIGAEVGWPPRVPSVSSGRFLSEDNVYAAPGFDGYGSQRNSYEGNESTAPAPALLPLAFPSKSRALAAASPLDHAHAHSAFEVRAYAATLPEVIVTPLSAAFQFNFDFEKEGEAEGEAGADENKAPVASRFLGYGRNQGRNEEDKDEGDVDDDECENEENQERPLEIPEPRMRGTRKPLGVLHFDEAASPPSAVHAEVAEAEKPFLVPVSVSPVGSEHDSEVSTAEGGGGLKGWARLRPKAPPAIKTGRTLEVGFADLEKGKGKGKEVNAGVGIGAHEVVKGGLASGKDGAAAPLIVTIPLPAVDSDKTNKVAELPVTPRRASLLRILNVR